MDSFKPTSRKNHPNSGSSSSVAAFRDALAGPGEARSLSSERREAVLGQAVQAVQSAAPRWGLVPLRDFRAALGAAAAVALALVALAVLPLTGPPGPSAVVPAGAAVEDLRVSNSEGHVVLQWDSAEPGRHRVIRATDPRALSTAPAQLVEGNTWVDPDTNGARLVFYRVEEAL